MSSAIKTYKTYMFTNKDPAIDELRTIVEDSKKSYSHISDKSGVSESTLYAWFHGDTRRPHNASIEAVARALGFRREFVPFTPKQKAKAKPRAASKDRQAAPPALH